MNPGALRLRRNEIRSKLFVPGARPELFAKAMAGPADSLSFDLEDSVVATSKDSARHAIATFLSKHGASTGKVNIVRVNSLDSDFFAADIAEVVVRGLHVINLPKVESKDDVLAAVEAIERAERNSGLEEQIGILANIETPKGLRLAFEIATAHPRVVGLQIGFVDFSLSCGIASSNRTALNAVRLDVRFAASEAGVAVFDGAFVAVKDPEGFRAEAEEARALGINGKSCIHPSQVPLANEIFSPGAAEIEQASQTIAAAEEAAAGGVGAFLLHGKMIDVPVIERARQVLTRAGLYRTPHASETK